jgi:hypothetical protein
LVGAWGTLPFNGEATGGGATVEGTNTGDDTDVVDSEVSAMDSGESAIVTDARVNVASTFKTRIPARYHYCRKNRVQMANGNSKKSPRFEQDFSVRLVKPI